MYDSQMHGEYLGAMLKDIFSSSMLKTLVNLVLIGWFVVLTCSFTGLRAGLVTSRVLAFSCDAKLCGVCSLDAMALQGLDFIVNLVGKAVVEKLFVATGCKA